jgi:hypothetical protein
LVLNIESARDSNKEKVRIFLAVDYSEDEYIHHDCGGCRQKWLWSGLVLLLWQQRREETEGFAAAPGRHPSSWDAL